jgi:hypothetical protein
MFDINEYLHGLVIAEDDYRLDLAKKTVEIVELGCDDAWLARAEHFGAIGALQSQIEYLANTLIPKAEMKISKTSSDGVGGESYSFNTFEGFSNSEEQHVNDEVEQEDLIDNQRKFVEGLKDRKENAGIRMITRIIAHDDLSRTLDQLTYGGIKARAAHNKKAREDAANNQELKQQYAMKS